MKGRGFILAALLVAGGAISARAQRVLAFTDVSADTAVQRTGPNRAYFQHFYAGYSPLVGSSQAGAPIKYGSTGEIILGWRQKWRFSQQLAVGADLQTVRLHANLRQTDAKVVPNSLRHERESLSWQQVQLGGFVRLNVGHRGNVIGRYLDVGGWGGWAFATTHAFRDEPAAGPVKVLKVTEHGLSYAQRWQYGLSARVGSSRYALVVRRRFSSLYMGREADAWPDLPRYSAGLEVGLL
ncbi:hypothetical protein PK28_09480 [Hymenobacter sp. DG25B]|uniref:hypothetical protein n=1 Tax=Hymenobacter sp. DG25B TaxID=1385664 RepID=UPI000540939A|nr:hypothetical protein [Hymenobacter sp. DG25B]AIZ63862.1 hypothetical protein PK28_09480 [Hymenobacter sp. DG25B]